MSCYQEEAGDQASIMQYHVLFDHLYDFKQYSQHLKSIQPSPVMLTTSTSYINFNLANNNNNNNNDNKITNSASPVKPTSLPISSFLSPNPIGGMITTSSNSTPIPSTVTSIGTSKNMSTTSSNLSTLPSPKVIAVQSNKTSENKISENKIDLQLSSSSSSITVGKSILDNLIRKQPSDSKSINNIITTTGESKST